MPRKYTRKQLRQPDEFVTFSMRAWEYIRGHLPFFLVSLGVAIVIVGGVWTWTYFANAKAARTTDEITRALEIYNQTILSEEDLKGAKPEEDSDIPRFKTQEEKLAAAEKELTTVIDQGGALATMAYGLRAGVRYDAGKYRDAIADYEKFIAQCDDQEFELPAVEAIGYSYEGLKELDKALAQFRLLPREGKARFRALYHEGRILAKQGKKDEARKLLEQVSNEAESTAIKEMAGEQLVLLQMEQPKK